MESEERQINIFKNKFKRSYETEIQMMILDALSTYGEKDVDAITELINDGMDLEKEVQPHGLRRTNDFKNNTKN
ncbi:MAG: hypothetical protein WKF36_09885 [Candidatus Nitrosocosmicus sp.]